MLIAQGWKMGLLVLLPGKLFVARAPTPSHGRIKKLFMREQRRGHLPRATAAPFYTSEQMCEL